MTAAISTKSKKHVRQDTHQQITDIIIEQLEQGVVPWQQPWKSNNPALNGLPFNTSTGNKYRGVNILLLWTAMLKNNFETNEWGTFNHWKAKGEYIRKGEKQKAMIIKYGKREVEVDGETEEVGYVQRFWVFNRSQLQSWKADETELAPQTTSAEPFERHAVLDEFVANTGAVIMCYDGDPCYNRVDDKIRLPYLEKFIDTNSVTAVEGYYSTLLHELTHWSGAPHRLNRVKGKRFGDSEYAYEELVAELGASFICAEHNISILQKGDHAAYIETWIKVLKDNKQMLVTAAADASTAFDYLYELQPT